jgi:cyclophilin family peptidyl-prolyl cis-trans isomerase
VNQQLRPPSGRRAKRRARRVDGVPTQPVSGRVSAGRASKRLPPPQKSWRNSPWVPAIAVFGGLLVVIAAWTLLGGKGGSGSPGASAVAHGQNCPAAEPAPLPAGESRTVTIKTSKGDIVIQVKADLGPIAAGNFVALASCGFYDGINFHRTAALSDGTPFVIQGGDPLGTGNGGPGYTIGDDPVTTHYMRGTVAMANSSAAHTQGSQFFIVLSDAADAVLTGAPAPYAIFGTVTSGMDVADAIYAASNGVEYPDSPIAMTSVTVSNP